MTNRLWPVILALAVCAPPAMAAEYSYWAAPEQATNSSSYAHNGAAAAGPDGALHLLSLDNRTDHLALYYQRRENGQATWSSALLLSHDSEEVQAGDNADLVMDGAGNLYAAWEEYFSGRINIYFSRSTDRGATWTTPAVVAGSTTSAARAMYPRLDVDDSGTLHLLWLDANAERVLYRKGTADAQTLSNPVILRSVRALGRPAVSHHGTELVACWQEDGASEDGIRFMRSVNGGDNWSDLGLGGTDAIQPGVVYDASGNFHAVWGQSNGDVIYQLWLAGIGFQPEKTMNAGDFQPVPSIAVSGQHVQIAWIQANALAVRCSPDGGTSFSELATFSDSFNYARPDTIADRENFRVFCDLGQTASAQVWQFLRDDAGPPAPQVTSASHPWAMDSGNNRPEFSWTASDNPGGVGIQGFAYTLDQQAGTDPGNTLTCAANVTSASFDEVIDGSYVFHIRAIDQLGNLGAVTHYSLTVANDDFFPADQAWVAPNPVRGGGVSLRFFLTQDADVRLEWFDATGRRIGTQRLAGHVGINQQTFDIGDWVNGTYFFRLTARAQSDGQETAVTKPFAVVR